MSTFTLKQETITGLSNSLDIKQDKNNAVTTDSYQTITCDKTFTTQMPLRFQVEANQQHTPSEYVARQLGLLQNKTYTKGDGFSSWIQGYRGSDGYTVSSLYVRRFLEDDENEIVAELNIAVEPNGNTVATCPSPIDQANGDQIATASWSRKIISMVPGNYINLTLGASDSKYTAPANGYVVLQKSSTKQGQEIRLTNLTNRLVGYATSGIDTNRALGCVVPCRKGDIINVFYSADGNAEWFRFVYTA